MFKSSGIKQDHAGKLYMVLVNTHSGETIHHYLSKETMDSMTPDSMKKVSFRKEGGHVW